MQLKRLCLPDGGGEIEYQVYGNGPEPLLVLHAAATGPLAYQRLATRLVQSEIGDRLSVLVPALHGYGSTIVVDRERSAEDVLRLHLRVAETLIAAHAAPRLHLFGHSMGGLLALELARTWPPDAAHELRTLCVYEPIVIGLLDASVAAERVALEHDRELVASLRTAVACGQPEPGVAAFIEAWNDTAWAALPAVARGQLIDAAPRLAADASSVNQYPIDPIPTRRLGAALGERVALLGGGQSPPICALMHHRLTACMPSARTELIAGAGHMGPILQTDPVAAALVDVLSRQIPKSGRDR